MTVGKLVTIAALAACSQTPGPRRLPTGTVAHRAAQLGVSVAAPAGAHVEERDGYAFVGDGTFKMNLFEVDEGSVVGAPTQKQHVESLTGFVKLTTEQVSGDVWRFDYELEGGKAGTIARIRAGRLFDCGVHGVSAAVALQVAEACAATAKL